MAKHQQQVVIKIMCNLLKTVSYKKWIKKFGKWHMKV